MDASQKAIAAALADDATGFTLPTNSRGIYLGDKRLDPIMQTLDDNHAIVALHPNAPGVEDPTVTSQIPAPIVEFFFDTTRTVLNMLQNGIFTSLSKHPLHHSSCRCGVTNCCCPSTEFDSGLKP